MSIIYKKEHGYPCDLNIKAEVGENGYYMITILIDGFIQPELSFNTKSFPDRKLFAKGFFAGIDYAEKKRA